MPYPNEHAARIKDPGAFIPESIRRKNITPGIDIIIGKIKDGDGSMETQAYRFDKEKYTPEQVKAWLKDHDIKPISFEPASEASKAHAADDDKDKKPTCHEFETEVFKVGTWNGDKYTTADLDDMVTNFSTLKEIVKPPIKLGHTDKAGQPALGWVKGLKRAGNILIATLSQVPEIVYKVITGGRYKRVSSEIYWDYKHDGKTFKRVFGALALLGAELPAVNTLRDLDAYLTQTMPSASFERVAIYAFDADDSGVKIKPEDSQMDKDETKIYTEKIAELEKIIATLKPEADEAKKYKADLAALKKIQADERKATQQAELKTFCEQAVKDGKLPPACRDMLCAFDKHAYSEETGYALPVASVIDMLKTYTKVILKLGEVATAPVGDKKTEGGEKHVFSLVEEKAKKIMAERKLPTLTDAYKAVFAEDPELAAQYLKETNVRGDEDE
jgi:hypothetical protein